MDLFSSFLQTLQIKNIKTISHSLLERDMYIVIPLSDERATSWKSLIRRFNLVYNQIFSFELLNTKKHYKLSFLTPEAVEILNYAIMKEEHLLRRYIDGLVYDVKVGISCNNNCLHCVVKPVIKKTKKEQPNKVILNSGVGMWYTEDPSLEEIIKRITSKNNIEEIVLTGGEPTIREDFVATLKWIYYSLPHTRVSIQTNGRNLSDENLVKAILRYSNDGISFAVAVHGMEKTHNEVVNNRKEKGNPFEETIQGIKYLLAYFPNAENFRTEIVISNKNKNELAEMIRFQHEELGIKKIGISYPHLCGFSKKDIIKIAPPMVELAKELEKINEYAGENLSLSVLTEEIPLCVYDRIDKKIHIKMFGQAENNIATCSSDGYVTNDFRSAWIRDHAKTPTCTECAANNYCFGIWSEGMNLNKSSLIPIKKLTKNITALINHSGEDRN